MYIEKKENKFFAFLIFLIWPFLSVALAIRNYRASWAKNIIWLFVAFFGYNMVINEEIDASRYSNKFVQRSNLSAEERNINIYAEGERDSLDFVEPLISAVISLFTSNYKILLAVYGLIFGFFYSRNIWIILNKLNSPFSFTLIILIFTFVLINPFWNINGFRYYTAAQVFIYGILLYFVEEKKAGIWFILSTFTIHFSFMIAIAIFVIYLFLGNRITLYFYFFVASLFIEGLQLETARDNLIYLPEIFQERTSSYVNEEYAESIKLSYETVNWYVEGKQKALHYAISGFLIFIFWKGGGFLRKEKSLYAYFCFVLLFYGLANMISSIPSAGRFLNPASSMAVSSIILIGTTFFFEGKTFSLLKKIANVLFIIFITVTIRIGFDVIGLGTIFGNPIFSGFMEYDKPLIDLIK